MLVQATHTCPEVEPDWPTGAFLPPTAVADRVQRAEDRGSEGGFFAFASEIKALLPLLPPGRELDVLSLHRYLWRAVEGLNAFLYSKGYRQA